MEEEIQKIFEDHERRLKLLEGTDHKKRKLNWGKSITDLLVDLRDEGFFSSKRTPMEILHRLSEKGHVYKRTQSLTGTLQRATKQEIIKREKTDSEWIYYV